MSSLLEGGVKLSELKISISNNWPWIQPNFMINAKLRKYNLKPKRKIISTYVY